MQISLERLVEFQQIWKQEFGEEISTAEAREAATRLVRFYDLIMRPLANQQKDAHVALIEPSGFGGASRTRDPEGLRLSTARTDGQEA